MEQANYTVSPFGGPDSDPQYQSYGSGAPTGGGENAMNYAAGGAHGYETSGYQYADPSGGTTHPYTDPTGGTTHPYTDPAGGTTYPYSNGTAPHADGVDVTGHAKELCVNKLGHTMVTPREGGTSRGRFRELFGRHRLKTMTYCSVFWSFGMGVAFLGPTLLDLECRISSPFSSMSWVFFSQSLFTLVGSACGGFLVHRLGSHVVLLVSVLMMGITLAVVPACKVLAALTTTLGFMGFFMGTIDTVANISMLQLYGRDVAPFLQALHFFYGLGAFLSPIITKPFLLNEDCNNLVLESEDTHRMLDINAANMTELAKGELETAQHNSRIQFAFWIMSAMQIPVMCLLLVLVYRDIFGAPEEEVQQGAKEALEMQQENNIAADGLTGARSVSQDTRDQEDRPQVTRRQIVMVTACAAGLCFIYDGLQAAYGGYIYTYAVRSIEDMAQNEAAYLNACFWGTFAFGRLMSIGIATRITPQWMLLGNLTGCVVAMVMMLSLPKDHTMLYIGTALFGTSLSSVFPTAVSMTETYIHVTSQITSALVMTAAVGEMVLPVIIGHEFDVMGPQVLLVSGVVLTVASFALYIVLFWVADGITRVSSENSLMERFKALIKKRAAPDEGIGLMTSNVKYYNRMRSRLSEGSLQQEETALSNPPPPPAAL